MPTFKSTYNIFLAVDEDEVFNPNWMDSNSVVVPPGRDWDYSRELDIDDIDIWEVIYEAGGGWGVYAAWDPYAEFYLITTGANPKYTKAAVNKNGAVNYTDKFYETFYGKGAQKKVQKRMKELKIPFVTNEVYVGNEYAWLFTD
jgi:hypothetical protein